MKDTSVFTPGRSNFGLLLSDSEQSGASDVSDHEEVQVAQAEAVEADTEEETEQPAADDEWLPVSHKKVRNPATPKHTAPHHRDPLHPRNVAFIGNGTKKLGQPAGAAHHHHQPVKVAEITADSALELHGFPSKFRTGNLRRFVETVIPTGYRIKWQNDSSCWVVFETPEMRIRLTMY